MTPFLRSRRDFLALGGPDHKTNPSAQKMSATCVFQFRCSLTAITQPDLEAFCGSWFKHWVFQHEKGDTGYEHYQGIGSLKKRRRQPELVKAMREQGGFVPEYLQPSCAAESKKMKNVKAMLDSYAGKADTRVAGPWSSPDDSEIYVPGHIRGKQLMGWQRQVYEIATTEHKSFDARTVHWIHDPVGGHGKSTFANVVEILLREGICLPVVNDAKELSQMFANWIDDKKITHPGIVMLDLPRAMPKNQMNGFISALEELKNGKATDTRYHFKRVIFDPPSVWVFSNTLPDTGMLSKDRWTVWEFDGDGTECNLRQK